MLSQSSKTATFFAFPNNPLSEVKSTKLIQISLLLIIIISAGNEAVGLSGSRTIFAKDIQDKVLGGELVDYNNVEIIGDINLKMARIHLNASNNIVAPISITDSVIYGDVIFDDAIMRESIDFRRTTFSGHSGFNRTEFLKDADFSNSQFNKTALFWRTKFYGTANFDGALFNESSNFWGSNFQGNPVRFVRTRFNDYAIFDSVQFNVEHENFEESKFLGPASFQNAKFGGLSDFRGIQFKDSVDFRSAQFSQPSDLGGAVFEKEVNLIGAKFVSLNVVWDSLKNKLICDGPTYLLLIKNFKELEQFEDADNCYYQYRDLERQNEPLGWGKLFDYMSWLSCGYGVRWQHPILSGIAIALLFGLYYESYCLRRKGSNFFGGQELKIPREYDPLENLKKSMSFSVMLLLSLPPEWSIFGRDEYAKFVTRHWFSSILERLIGWGLVLLLIGTLTRLMVRY